MGKHNPVNNCVGNPPEGIVAFFDFSKTLAPEKALLVAAELKAAVPRTGILSPALVMTVHGVLCDDRTGQRLGDMLDPSSIGFFMDVCEHRLETARLKREGISLECLVADALALTDCHNRHMASYTPAVMQGGEEPEMDVPNSPLDYVAVAQITRPLDDFTESVTMSTAAVIGKKRGGRAAIEAWVTELGAPVDADHPQSLVAQLGVPSAVLLVATLRKLRLKLLREVIEIMKERVAQKL